MSPVLRNYLDFKYFSHEKVTINFNIPKTPELSIFSELFHFKSGKLFLGHTVVQRMVTELYSRGLPEP